MTKVFIDGSAGTTGLRIYNRLAARGDVELIALGESERKELSARKRALNAADFVFLCLPDDAAIEAAGLVENPNTVIIDASTAHRTDPAWAYGFPELGASFREKIARSKKIAVPGCHASGFIALVRPLVSAGIISSAAKLTCFSLTGYSGGGKKMIEDYKTRGDFLYEAPRQYALSQSHKHLKEMTAISGLDAPPCFSPVVGDYFSGMEVSVWLFKSQLCGAGREDVINAYKSLYKTDIVKYCDKDEDGFLSAAAFSGLDSMSVSVHGNEERILLVARFDNLGKGASGAAVQCFNIAAGKDEKYGLNL